MTISLEDYRVELDDYSGPLDLLLFLVKKNEIDLHDIPIATLAEQYLHHLERMQQFDINVAADFLVMAATLLEIKAKLIAPAGEEDADGDDAGDALSDVDPRFELVQQLLAYKRFKDAANELDDRRIDWAARFPHRPAKAPKPAQAQGEAGAEGDESVDGDTGDATGDATGGDAITAEQIELDLEDVSVTDLCEAFARILESIGQGKAVHAVTYDDTPISLHAEDIVDRLKRDGALKLQQIFVGRQTRGEMIGLFLATLELVRQKRVRVLQEKAGGDIQLELRSEAEQQEIADEPAADWRDPETGEVQYDWPDDEARQRFEARKARAVKRARGEFDEDDEEEAYIELEPVELELSSDPEVEDGDETAVEDESEKPQAE